MEYKDTIKDIITRSERNLEIIKKNDGFEFTQMFCMFTATLVLIKENKKIGKGPIRNYGLNCKIINNTYKKDFSEDTSEFIRHLRNACCHNRVTFTSTEGEISKVIFEDEDKGNKAKCKFTLTIEEIDKVREFLIKMG